MDSSTLLSIAQVASAAALIYLTYRLMKSTSDYSEQVKLQTGIMEKNVKLAEDQAKTDIEKLELTKNQTKIDREKLDQEISLLRYKRLRDEMDKLIAPLYFAALEVNENRKEFWRFELINPVQRMRGESNDFFAFWDGIKHNSYLSRDTELYGKLVKHFSLYEDYFTSDGSDGARTNYIMNMRELIYALKERRYTELQRQIKEVESDLGINIVRLKGSISATSQASGNLKV